MVADIIYITDISLAISQCINSVIKSSKFLQSLKLSDISPIFKNRDKFLKEKL